MTRDEELLAEEGGLDRIAQEVDELVATGDVERISLWFERNRYRQVRMRDAARLFAVPVEQEDDK